MALFYLSCVAEGGHARQVAVIAKKLGLRMLVGDMHPGGGTIAIIHGLVPGIGTTATPARDMWSFPPHMIGGLTIGTIFISTRLLQLMFRRRRHIIFAANIVATACLDGS